MSTPTVLGFSGDGTAHRGDDPTPVLEHERHIKMVSLCSVRSERVSEVLEMRRRASNPMVMLGMKPGGKLKASEGLSAKTKLTKMFIAMAKKRLPPLEWVPAMTRQTLMSDIIAGLTVGVMAIPQSMSYAAIVGVPYVIGMYTAFVPTVVYAFLGTSRQLCVGPVAMESLLIASGLSGLLTPSECPKWYAKRGGKSQAQLCPEAYTNLVLATTLVVGMLECAASLLGLGVLLRFMGKPVITGFTAGSAVVIMTSQLKDVLGIKLSNYETVQEVIEHVIGSAHKTSGLSVALALTFIAYLFLHKYATRHRVLKKYLWPIAPLGPLVVIVVGALMLQNNKGLRDKLRYVGKIPKGMPPVHAPFTTEMLGRVLPTAIGAFVVGDMEAIAIGKGLASKNGYSINPQQELIAQGIANLVGGFCSCYTATGSFSRSAVNDATGAKTQLAAFISALVMMFTLLFLTEWFFWVPRFALAAVVISSVVPLIDLGNAVRLFKVSKQDFIVWLTAAMLVMFLGILEGIAAGVALSLAIVIYETAQPQLAILWRIPGTTIYRSVKQESNGTFVPNVFICRIGSSLYFANVVYVKEMLLKYVDDLKDLNKTEYLVLEMTPVISMDYSASQVLEDVVRDFRRKGIELAFAQVGTRVRSSMALTGLDTVIGERWFFNTVNEAVIECLRDKHMKSLTDDDMEASSQGLERPLVCLGTELAISNDMSKDHTVVFVNVADHRIDVITDIMQHIKIMGFSVKGASAEESEGTSWRHRYSVQKAVIGGKLSDEQVGNLKASLGQLLDGTVPLLTADL